MSKPVKIILIVVVALLVITPIVIFLALPKFRLSKAASRALAVVEKMGPEGRTSDKAAIKEGLKKLTSDELKVFSEYLQAHLDSNTELLAKLAPDVIPMYNKTGLKLF